MTPSPSTSLTSLDSFDFDPDIFGTSTEQLDLGLPSEAAPSDKPSPLKNIKPQTSKAPSKAAAAITTRDHLTNRFIGIKVLNQEQSVSKHDVLLVNTRIAANHPGNSWFRKMIYQTLKDTPARQTKPEPPTYYFRPLATNDHQCHYCRKTIRRTFFTFRSVRAWQLHGIFVRTKRSRKKNLGFHQKHEQQTLSKSSQSHSTNRKCHEFSGSVEADFYHQLSGLIGRKELCGGCCDGGSCDGGA